MRGIALAPLVALLSLCFGGCRSLPEADKSKARDPETAVEYLMTLIRRGEYGKAHYLLSAETRQHLRAEPFALALQSYPTLRRLILATRIRGLVEPHRVQLENPVLGIEPAFELRKEFDAIWTVHIGKAEWDLLLERGREFVFLQFEREGGYHVFPPDHKFVPLSSR
jgi:hypothetical protein